MDVAVREMAPCAQLASVLKDALTSRLLASPYVKDFPLAALRLRRSRIGYRPVILLNLMSFAHTNR